MKLFALLIVIITAASCNVMYMPNMQNVPLLKEKGESEVSLSMRNVQAAYAVTDKLGLTVNGFYLKNDLLNIFKTNKSFNFRQKDYALEVGAGTFTKVIDPFFFDVYTGFGWGYSSLLYDEYYLTKFYDNGAISNFYKWYLQPNLTIKYFSISGRLQYVDFYNYHNPDRTIASSKQCWFIDPAATFRYGQNGFYAKFQVQYSIPLNPAAKTSDYMPFDKLLLASFAIEFRFSELKEFYKKK